MTVELGMASPEDVKHLTDKAIQNMGRTLGKPGGTIPDPNVAGARIPHPGFRVAPKAIALLEDAKYYIKHQDRISRTVTAADITVQNVRTLQRLREIEEEYKNPDVAGVKLDLKDWPKSFEYIDEIVRTTLGCTGIPLARLTRGTNAEDIAVPAEGGDPATNYVTPMDEMIARAPINLLDPVDIEDNRRALVYLGYPDQGD